MKRKALITAAILIVTSVLGGCETKEISAGKYAYSKPFFSDSSGDPSSSGIELDVSRSHDDSDITDNSTDSDIESSSEKSHDASSSSSAATRITRQEVTVYTYTESSPSEQSEDTGGDHTDSENAKTETDTDTAADADTSSDSDTDITDTDSEIVQSDTDNRETQSVFEEADLEFVIGEARIKLGDKISDHEEALGNPLHITDITGVNGEIVSRTYGYEDFSIDTVPDDAGKSDIVSAIQIFNDTIITEKGIKTGDPIEKVVGIYGNDWMRCEDEYRYYIGNEYMYFYVQNDIVANIGYKIDKDMEN